MTEDPYRGFAERYDWIKEENPIRREFFEQIFAEHHVSKVLDCACGTGRDLLMFHSMGLEVFGSDVSDSMLAQARKNVRQFDVPLRKVDYRELAENYGLKFDAVVCLTNSINEPREDAETLRAVRSMSRCCALVGFSCSTRAKPMHRCANRLALCRSSTIET